MPLMGQDGDHKGATAKPFLGNLMSEAAADLFCWQARRSLLQNQLSILVEHARGCPRYVHPRARQPPVVTPVRRRWPHKPGRTETRASSPLRRSLAGTRRTGTHRAGPGSLASSASSFNWHCQTRRTRSRPSSRVRPAAHTLSYSSRSQWNRLRAAATQSRLRPRASRQTDDYRP